MKKNNLFYRTAIVFSEWPYLSISKLYISEKAICSFLFLLYVCVCSQSYGQISAPVQIDVFPPAPNAASLGKIIDMPVSLYTGTPSIDIPIWTVEDGDLKLPVSLSYQSGGIKVQEISSWVGIGWALQSGGVVTRTVRGLPDDLPYGYLDPITQLPTTFENTPSGKERFARYAVGSSDSQPDLFTFNFGEKGGKFQLDQNRNCYLTPFQKIKVQHSPSAGPILEWTITTEDGTIYKFNIRERSRSQSYCDFGGQSTPADLYTTSWYLSSITSPKGATINFIYETGFSFYYPIATFDTRYEVLSGSGNIRPHTKCISYNDIGEGVRLKKITYSSGELEFVAGGNRADLPNDKMLQTIIVRDYAGNTIRNFKFAYQYMLGDNLVSSPAPGYVASDATKYRLTLVSVQEVDGNGNSSKPPYEFYYNTGLPDRLSYAVDHWGYYNGKTENTTLVPEEEYGTVVLPGANRNAYLEHTVKGALNKIIYPLGGSTTFSFELNQADRGQPETIDRAPKLMSDVFSGNAAKVLKQEPFTVNNIGKTGAYVKINVNNIPCDADFGQCPIEVKICKKQNGAPGEVVFSSLSIQNKIEIPLFLANGDYFLTNAWTSHYKDNETYRVYDFTVNWTESTGNPNYFIGGLRISRVVDYDPVTGKSMAKVFKYLQPDNKTSGRTINLPKYGYNYSEDYIESIYNFPYVFNASYYVRTATPTIPMGLTQGSHVGYGLVTVYHGEWLNGSTTDIGYSGKTEYYYTTPETHPDKNISDGYPFSPVDSRDWMRGALLKQIEYKREGQNYVQVKKIENEYNFYDEINPNNNVQNCLGLKVAFYSRTAGLGGNFVYNYFNFYTGYKELVKTKEITYDQNDVSKFITKETRFEYSPIHLQLSKKQIILSDGKILTEYVSYPLDYEYNAGSQFIEDLKTANIVNAPVESVSYKSDADGNNVNIISGHINTYKAGGKGLLTNVSYLETTDPIPLLNFKFSNREYSGVIPPNGTTISFSPSTVYKSRIRYTAYDDWGNILSYTKDNQITSILWGYKSTLPVAKIINATTSTDITSSTQIAYNGFESGTSSVQAGWENITSQNIIDKSIEPANVYIGRYAFKMGKAPSGGTYWGPTFNLKPPTPQKGKYKLSCWIKTPIGYTTNKASLWMYTMRRSNCCDAYPNLASSFVNVSVPATNDKWRYFELIIDFESIKNSVPNDNLAIRCFLANSDSNSEVYLDEIKICPVDAQMTTYTYDPQIGLTSENSPNGKITFYEYDTLGRLKNVKNRDGNIINSYSYMYGKK